jgi:type II secretory pathway pseudopilin PulG
MGEKMKKRSNQQGFEIVSIIIIALAIGVVGFVAWYVWHVRSANNQFLNDVSQSEDIISGGTNSPTDADATSTPTPTPVVPTATPTPPVLTAVTAASVSVNPTSFDYALCSTDKQNFRFTASITANGAGVVTYYWSKQTIPAIPAGGTPLSNTVYFSGASTKDVYFDWPWGSIIATNHDPWSWTATATLHITSPSYADTPSASYTVSGACYE